MPFRRTFRRKRVRRLTANKGPQKHSGTLVSNLGPASAPISLQVLATEGGTRTVDGTEENYSNDRSTGETCNVGDLIKFVNCFIEVGPRATATEGDNISTGFLEWAFLCLKENDTVIPITNLGTLTLGTIANRMFPDDTLLSGFIPIGEKQANGAMITIKIPKKFQFLTKGDEWLLYLAFRTTSSTSTGTDKVRVLSSFIYKAYA